MPKVSVIMGTYNCKNFDLLEKSVDSVLDQEFEDFELIICDDGSENDTLLYLNRLKQKDNRIKIISYKENRGLSYALNTCLNEAQGQYIARQDDDDISKVGRLRREVEFLDNHPEFAMVGTEAEIFDNDGIWGDYKLEEYPTRNSFYWNSPFIHPTIMMRKNVYTELGGYRVAKETRRCEDLDLFMKMYAAGYKGYNIQEKLYMYRMENDPNIKYRKMKYRIDEAVVKFKGYRAMGNLLLGLPFVIKPILIGLMPQRLLYLIKKKQY